MKSAVMVTLFAALSLLGFSGAAQAQNCSGHHITVQAKGGHGNQDPYVLVTPEVYNEKKGCSFEVRIPDGYTTILSSDEADWLNLSGHGAPIVVTIPDGEANGDYKYDVEIVNWADVDPRVRVN